MNISKWVNDLYNYLLFETSSIGCQQPKKLMEKFAKVIVISFYVHIALNILIATE